MDGSLGRPIFGLAAASVYVSGLAFKPTNNYITLARAELGSGSCLSNQYVFLLPFTPSTIAGKSFPAVLAEVS